MHNDKITISRPKLEALRGIVEVDETYVGGKEANRHETKRKSLGRGAVGKVAVLGMRERGGRTIAMPVEDVNTANLHRAIHTHIEAGATLHTDEHAAYKGLNGLFFKSESVNHSAGEYVRDGVTTNGIESVWAVMKRGLQATWLCRGRGRRPLQRSIAPELGTLRS